MDIKSEIKGTLSILAAICVSGDAVDYMAAARAKLKKIYQELDSKEAKEDG